jgi:hypothetical protein
MADVVCSACGRKVDPDRSFCRNCGSASFADESDERIGLTGFTQVLSAPEIKDAVARLPARMPPRRPGPMIQPAPSSTTRRSSPAAASAGCIAGLVRLVIFIAIVWYVGRWLFGIPEVASLRDAMLTGAFSDQQVNAALEAIRAHVADLLR